MNCQNAREQLTDMLATGHGEIAGELRDHLHDCAGCRKFHAQEAELFRVMESGLSAMVSEPVPVSLLPMLRAQWDSNQTHRNWLSHTLTLTGAMALVLFAVILFPRSVKRHTEVSVTAIPTLVRNTPAATQHEQVTAAANTPRLTPKVVHANPGHPAHGTGTPSVPEVLVLREEREAFALFLAELPREREIAVALTRPAPQGDEQAVEVTLLKTGVLNIRLLEPATPDEDLN